MKYTAIIIAALVAINASGQMKITNDDRSAILGLSALGAVSSETVNANGNPVGVDSATRWRTTIDGPHHEKHDGNSYTAGIQDLDLDTGETNGVVVIVANTTKWPHVLLAANNSVAGDAVIYRGASVTTNGTEVASFNSDHNSTNTAGMKIYLYSDSTVTNLGTEIDAHLFGAPGPGFSGIGGEAARPESIYKQNTAYVILMVGVADNGRMNMDFDWYEHTNKTD